MQQFGPAATTRSGRLTRLQLDEFKEYTQITSDELAKLPDDNPEVQNVCKFADALNRFAELYSQADDGFAGTNALMHASRHTMRRAQRMAMHSIEALNPVPPMLKLGLFIAGEIGRYEQFEQTSVFTSAEEREQIATEYYEYLTEQNRAMSAAAKQTIERLKAMPWDERAETVAQLGLDLLVFHGAGKFTGAILAKFIALSTEFKAIAAAERVAAAAGKASAPITELGQQVAVVGKITVQKGTAFTEKVIKTFSQHPELVEVEGSVDGALMRIAGDFERECTGAAEDLGSFRRGDGGRGSAPAPSAGQRVEDVTWVNHGNKHVPQPNMTWNEIIKSTANGGKAKYHPGIKNSPGIGSIEALERHAWETGTPVISDKPNKIWKVKKMDYICGACDGKETQYMRIEYCSGFIHGHPITEAEYLMRLKAK